MEQTDSRLINVNNTPLEWIESLRGIAALFVFISHLDYISGTPAGFIIGRIGVVLFFLISGYLAIGSRQKKTRVQYGFNRFSRMYPVYWIILILTFTLGHLLDRQYRFSIKDLILNMTLFHEFLGSECIIGASWMMPIQVCFFVSITVFNADFWTKQYLKLKTQLRIGTLEFVTIGLLLCSIGTGYLRYRTGFPFPSAFFLLMTVAFLGLYWKKLEVGGGVSHCTV